MGRGLSFPLVLLEIDCAWSDQQCADHLAGLPEGIQARAQRYLQASSRRTLIASRVRLAQVLEALGFSDRQVQTAENGRPFLLGQNLQFNLTHSHKRAALALSVDPDLFEGLGVDLEWMPRPVEVVAVGKRFFSGQEHRWVGDDASRFYRIWTRKEAVLKSNGIGLRMPLDSFEVLEDQVAEAVTGRGLQLSTVEREGDYLLSWAVSSTPSQVHILSDKESDWLERLTALLGPFTRF